MASRPTNSRRNKRQKVKANYAKAREEAQLAGVIPTVPEGAVRDERVAPSVQGNQPMADMIAQAIRKGWKVDEAMKPHLVDELVGIVMNDEMKAKDKVAAFNALRMADAQQQEIDNPEQVKSKSNATQVSVTIQNNIQTAAVIREMVMRGELGIIEEVQPPDFTGASSSGGQQREMETSETPTIDK